MASLNFILHSLYLSTFLVHIFLLLHLQPICGDEFYVYSSCSTTETFTGNDMYDKNLENLTTVLYADAAQSHFSLSSYGEFPDQIHGLALCQDDMSSTDCTTCLMAGGISLRALCRVQKTSVIWYERCLLKYSNEEFFGKIDYQNWFTVPLYVNVNDPNAFNEKAIELLRRLADEAAVKTNMYAAGKIDMKGSDSYNNNFQEIFGMTQCTRDLWYDDCKKCLKDSIDLILGCCQGKVGVHIVGGSCVVRYQTYPFVLV